MAAAVEMGEVDDFPSKEESKEDVLVNGNLGDEKEDKIIKDVNDSEDKVEETQEAMETEKMEDAPEVMEVDKSTDSEKDVSVTKSDSVSDEISEQPKDKESDEKQLNKSDDKESRENSTLEDKVVDATEDAKEAEDAVDTADTADTVDKVVSDDEVTEVHTIDSDDDDEDDDDVQDTSSPEKATEENEAEPEEKEQEHDDNDDVMIVEDDIKENGTSTVSTPDKGSDECTVVDADLTPKKDGDATSPTNSKKEESTPRRSSRQQHLAAAAAAQAKRVIAAPKEISDESDIEEVMEEDPLAGAAPAAKKQRKSATIVVKDTKRLVEIAAKTSPPTTGKKEPTLVIIDTNSILSGRGPLPAVPGQKTGATAALTTTQAAFNMLPIALPAQGLYPANMRATITPIPMNNTAKALPALTPVMQTQAAVAAAAATAILPSLTDDMFVVEAPSFIVPYVYEKPPMKDFREYVAEMAALLKKEREAEEKNGADDDDIEEIKDDDSDIQKKDDEKVKTYFDSPIGKFFVDIGCNLVQEYVQTDLLKQQKRKRDREGGCNAETNRTIQSLLKSLEYTKENNQPYRTSLKKCEFCSYKSDSKLAMDFHLETPHMKNFVYRCNFCTYEVRSPHDILFHMEAEHCVRGRLERAPAFHQCPNCPFEDNQKGKLSRHSVACAKKFKPERNMEPPLDWEPPAKIPRQPRMKTPNLAMTAAMYQAMAKSTQAQFIKTHAAAAATLAQQQAQQSAVNRGRGRPSLGMSSGSSVLVPTNFQISGNQLYQVVGGQDLGSRLGGPVGLFPTLSSTSNSITIQNSTPKAKTVHQPSISITPLPRGSTSSSHNMQGGGVAAGTGAKPGDSNSKNSFVICEICDGYIKDLEQLRNHMQWIHKVKIHPKMIYNRPPLNCQKCQFRFFTDQGLERHLLGSHGLVTSSMQEAANKCKDSGRCPVCGRVYQWKLLNHVARDHNMTLKPAHLSYKCTVCTATFGMYKQFENHVYSAHSVVAKRSIDKKSSSASPASSSKGESLLKPLKINDEITIIPQMPKSNGAGSSKEATSRSSLPSTSRSKLDKREASLSGSAIDSGEIQIINLG